MERYTVVEARYGDTACAALLQGAVSQRRDRLGIPLAPWDQADWNQALATARAVHQKYYRLLAAFLKLDTNPVPVKTAMALKGMMRPDLRLPMVQMPEAKVEELRAVMRELGVA